MKIGIYNTTRLDKRPEEFGMNIHYKASGGSKFGPSDNEYINILKEAVPHRLKQIPIKDEPLSEEETNELKKVLENRIKELLKGRKPVKFGRPTIHFLGEEIKLDIFPSDENLNDGLINTFFKSYDICCECLQEKKPVYLSIFEEE